MLWIKTVPLTGIAALMVFFYHFGTKDHSINILNFVSLNPVKIIIDIFVSHYHTKFEKKYLK